LVRGLNITARFARGAKVAEVNGFSIAVDLPPLKLWQGKEDGDGKALSSFRCGKSKAR
jgi:hypothetical protein